MYRPTTKIKHELDTLDNHKNYKKAVYNIFKIMTHKSTPNLKIYNDIHYICLKSIRKNELNSNPNLFIQAIDDIKNKLSIAKQERVI